MKEAYKFIKEDECSGYILDVDNNTIVVLCRTLRPDLGFKKLTKLIDEANINIDEIEKDND